MRLLITGANGFIGQRVVGAALERGHQVRATVRPGSDVARCSWAGRGVELARVDLRDRGRIAGLADDVDGVVHLAAEKRGDLHHQLASTVVGTENLCNEVARAGTPRFVLLSSFTVYDGNRLRNGAALDENAPTEEATAARDPYTTTKLLQEAVVRDVVGPRATVVVLRAGVVYGPNETWSLRLGFQVRPSLWVLVGGRAPVPLVHVEDCAAAVVRAVEAELGGWIVVNVVGDETPAQRHYVAQLLDVAPDRPTIVRVPLALVRGGAWLLELIGERGFEGQLRLPSAISRSAVAARYSSFRYPNRRAKELLGWRPAVTVAAGLSPSAAGEEVGERGLHIAPTADQCVSGPSDEALRREPGVPQDLTDGRTG